MSPLKRSSRRNARHAARVRALTPQTNFSAAHTRDTDGSFARELRRCKTGLCLELRASAAARLSGPRRRACAAHLYLCLYLWPSGPPLPARPTRNKARLHETEGAPPARAASTARAAASTWRSVPAMPATISPTGASPCSWHGSETAHPSSMLIRPVLRSRSRL